MPYTHPAALGKGLVQGTGALAAARRALGNFIADQGTGGSAKDSAGNALTAGINRAAQQRADGGTDQQADGAIAAAAVIAAIVTLPVADAVIGAAIGDVAVLGAIAMGRGPARRIGESRAEGRAAVANVAAIRVLRNIGVLLFSKFVEAALSRNLNAGFHRLVNRGVCAPSRADQPSAACFSSASWSSSARLSFWAVVLSWPQAASISRPRGVRTGR